MAVSTRRKFVTRFAVISGAAAIPGVAQAFSYSEGNDTLRDAYQSACQSRQFHADLLDQVRRGLTENGRVPTEAEVRRVAASMQCPLCGCPVTTGLSTVEPDMLDNAG